MTNPFDRNFFRFLSGFILILGITFSVLYLVGFFGAKDDNTARLSR